MTAATFTFPLGGRMSRSDRMRGASRIDTESETLKNSRLSALASMCAAPAALDVSASQIRCVPDGTRYVRLAPDEKRNVKNYVN